MRIVLTVHQFLPDFSSGTEVITLSIARELRERGHHVIIVTAFPDPRRLADAERFDSYRYDGFRVERFRHAAHPMGDQGVVTELGYQNRLFAGAFRKLLAEIQPELVHFIHLSRLSASLIEPCVERGIPTLFTATDFWALCPFSQLRLPDNSPCSGPDRSGVNCVRHFMQKLNSRRVSLARLARHSPDWMLGLGMRATNLPLPIAPRLAAEVRAVTQRQNVLRRELNRLDRVLVPGRLMERMLLQGGIEPERIRLLPYGVETGRITRSTERGVGEVLRLGFLGSVSEHKGVDVAVAAIRLLDPSLPVELSIHGAPGRHPEAQAYYRRLESLARADERIRLCGPYEHVQVGEVLSSIDVLTVPSIWHENTPLVVYEAFAAGCPVIASDVEGIAEVVRHDVDGLLFERGDPAALAACVRQLAEDRTLLGRLARRTRMPLSVADHVTELEREYAQVLREPSRVTMPAGSASIHRRLSAAQG